LGAGDESQRTGGRQDVAEAFVIDIEEGAVSNDRSLRARGPLVEVVEGSGLSYFVAEELIRVHGPAVPHINCIAMKLISSGFSDVSDLRSRVLAVLRRIRAVNYVGFADVVRAQKQVRRAAIVDAKERVVVILAINGEQVGGGGHAIRNEIAVTGLRIHDHAGRGLGDVGDVAAGIGEVLNHFATESSADVRVFRLENRGAFHDVDRLGSTRNG